MRPLSSFPPGLQMRGSVGVFTQAMEWGSLLHLGCLFHVASLPWGIVCFHLPSITVLVHVGHGNSCLDTIGGHNCQINILSSTKTSLQTVWPSLLHPRPSDPSWCMSMPSGRMHTQCWRMLAHSCFLAGHAPPACPTDFCQVPCEAMPCSGHAKTCTAHV